VNDIKTLVDVARNAWHTTDETGTEDYDELWTAVVTSIVNAMKGVPVTAREEQVGGAHYKNKEVQPWDAMESWMTPEAFQGFLTGNVIKYMARWKEKNGVEDLRKARHYLSKLIEEVTK